MLYLTAQTPILLASQPIDFRKQFDGLIAICSRHLQQNPRSGTRFVFINRARTMIRVLTYDGSGYWLATKRLSRGRFTGWPTSEAESTVFDAKALLHLLQSHTCQKKENSLTYSALGGNHHV